MLVDIGGIPLIDSGGVDLVVERRPAPEMESGTALHKE